MVTQVNLNILSSERGWGCAVELGGNIQRSALVPTRNHECLAAWTLVRDNDNGGTITPEARLRRRLDILYYEACA